MNHLRDWAGGCGQWGEGGMLAEMERRTGITISVAVEFGAGDSAALINTLDLAHRGAVCLWAEADATKMPYLLQYAESQRLGNVSVRHTTVTDIDELIDGWPVPELISIDVDGPDYDLLSRMQARPAFLVVEHNPTVPPDVHWIGHHDRQGASARALVGLASSMGYGLVGATGANLLFARSDNETFAPAFGLLETRLEVIFDRGALNYVVSDYDGNYQMTGPWAWGRGEETEEILLP